MTVNESIQLSARAVTSAPPDVSCCSAITDAVISTDDARAAAAIFGALADPVRLRLLSLIGANDEACSCHFEEPLGKSQPTISHHTKILADAGLIVGEKRGRWTYWKVVPSQLAAVAHLIGEKSSTSP